MVLEGVVRGAGGSGGRWWSALGRLDDGVGCQVEGLVGGGAGGGGWGEVLPGGSRWGWAGAGGGM